MIENDESVNVRKSMVFYWKYNKSAIWTKSTNRRTYQNLSISVGHMKILKIRWTQQKSTTPRMHIITVVFEEKTMLTLQDKNQQLQECL